MASKNIEVKTYQNKRIYVEVIDCIREGTRLKGITIGKQECLREVALNS